jgi:hypothetical protein
VAVGVRAISSGYQGVVKTRTGKLAKVYPEIRDGRVEADVEVDGLGGYFVGERTLVWIPVGKRKAIVLPASAVTTRHGVDTVKIILDGNSLDVPVVLGEAFTGGIGDRVEILTGIHEGDRVVLP